MQLSGSSRRLARKFTRATSCDPRIHVVSLLAILWPKLSPPPGTPCVSRGMALDIFEAIATDTVESLLEDVAASTGHRPAAAVSCEYLGRYDERTGTILSGLARSVPKRAGVVFLYKVENESVARSVVLANCKHVLERARVPLPRGWAAALAATVLPRKADAAAVHICASLGDARCTVWLHGGCPDSYQLLDAFRGNQLSSNKSQLCRFRLHQQFS